MNKPSIVFFMLDQLSAKWLEAAEQGVCLLPNVGRLRRMGTSFSNAVTSNPVCCAARATLATGLTSRGHGVLENGYALNQVFPPSRGLCSRPDGGQARSAKSISGPTSKASIPTTGLTATMKRTSRKTRAAANGSIGWSASIPSIISPSSPRFGPPICRVSPSPTKKNEPAGAHRSRSSQLRLADGGVSGKHAGRLRAAFPKFCFADRVDHEERRRVFASIAPLAASFGAHQLRPAP